MKTLTASQNNFFSFSRFGRLFMKHSLENLPIYLLSLLVLFGIMSALLGFVSYLNGGYLEINVQGRMFITILIFAGPVFTSMIFADLGDRKKAIPILMLPVSHFEKYLVAWLYSFVVFLLAFTVCFYASGFMITQIIEMSNGRSNPLINLFTDKGGYWKIFFAYFAIHAVFLLGAIYFKKQHFIRTSFAFLIIMVIIGAINYLIARLVFQVDIASVGPFQSLRVLEGDKGWTIQAGDASHFIEGIVLTISVLVLWLCVYFKLKEREV